eukprot:6211760-Pleurochrysis_carterae.AAC.2
MDTQSRTVLCQACIFYSMKYQKASSVEELRCQNGSTTVLVLCQREVRYGTAPDGRSRVPRESVASKMAILPRFRSKKASADSFQNEEPARNEATANSKAKAAASASTGQSLIRGRTARKKVPINSGSASQPSTTTQSPPAPLAGAKKSSTAGSSRSLFRRKSEEKTPRPPETTPASQAPVPSPAATPRSAVPTLDLASKGLGKDVPSSPHVALSQKQRKYPKRFAESAVKQQAKAVVLNNISKGKSVLNVRHAVVGSARRRVFSKLQLTVTRKLEEMYTNKIKLSITSDRCGLAAALFCRSSYALA